MGKGQDLTPEAALGVPRPKVAWGGANPWDLRTVGVFVCDREVERQCLGLAYLIKG